MRARALLPIILLGTLVAGLCPVVAAEYRRLPAAQYRDKMMGGWIGQIAGVCLGAPTEFRWQDAIIPEDQVPKWTDDMINNAFGQDDLYVEMTFLRTMEVYGLDCSIRQAGIDFANSEYALWCANRAGRENLRRGIAPPDSGHPRFSRNSDDIDYQIEADYSGLIAPGMPTIAIALGEKFGRLMNYGDGLYAGQFMGGMYAEAFFETDIENIVRTGLKCIPVDSQYAEMVRDLLRWHRQFPDEWERAWALVQAKYSRDPGHHRYAVGGIDVKLNGACVLLGLLYGERDLHRTIAIACRAGWDSDCNPSSAGGVLFTTVGYKGLPDTYKAKLKQDVEFSYTAYTFPKLIDVCEKLARQAVARVGGRIEKDAEGQEVFVIPVIAPKPGRAQPSWAPGPAENSRFTKEEMKQVKFADELTRAMETVAPGWTLSDCGPDMGAPSLLAEYGGRRNVLITHPLNRETGSVLSKQVEVPAAGTTTLKLTVGHFPEGDWVLQVKADGKVLLERTIGRDTTKDGWADIDVDLSAYAGKTITLDLVNQPNGWAYEAAYWARIAVESR